VGSWGAGQLLVDDRERGDQRKGIGIAQGQEVLGFRREPLEAAEGALADQAERGGWFACSCVPGDDGIGEEAGELAPSRLRGADIPASSASRRTQPDRSLIFPASAIRFKEVISIESFRVLIWLTG
jgi:hypothetical protein